MKALIYSDFTNTEEWGFVTDITLIGVTYDITVDSGDIFEHKFIAEFKEISNHMFTVEVWQDLDNIKNVVLVDNEYNSYFNLPEIDANMVMNEFDKVASYIK